MVTLSESSVIHPDHNMLFVWLKKSTGKLNKIHVYIFILGTLNDRIL